MGKLSKDHKALLLEKNTYDEQVVALTAEAAPAEDEPEEAKGLKTL